MSIEVIKAVGEAEKKAENIKKEASIQAKSIITDANAEAQNILEKAKKTAASNRESVISKAESDGQILYENIINDASKECDEISKLANDNMSNVASIILERIVKTSGNS